MAAGFAACSARRRPRLRGAAAMFSNVVIHCAPARPGLCHMGQVCDLSVLAIEYGKDKLIGYRSISDTVDQDFEIDTLRVSLSGKIKLGPGSSS